MKKTLSLFSILVLIVVISFSFVGCGESEYEKAISTLGAYIEENGTNVDGEIVIKEDVSNVPRIAFSICAKDGNIILKSTKYSDVDLSDGISWGIDNSETTIELNAESETSHTFTQSLTIAGAHTGTEMIYGSIDAVNYRDHDKLNADKFEDPDSITSFNVAGEEQLVLDATSSVPSCLFYFNQFLDESDLGLTIEDFGFAKYNSEE